MKIGIDIDNVISKFDEGMFQSFLEHDKSLRNSGVIDSNSYITRGMFDWSNDEFLSFYKSNIDRIVSSLDVKEDASKYIKKLKSEGNTIVIITGRDNGEYIDPYGMTKKWLKEHDIIYDKLILTDLYKNDKHAKTRECINNQIDLMIDDSSTICLDCIEHGIPALLMDTKYNKDAKLPRVKNWKEIYEVITNKKS